MKLLSGLLYSTKRSPVNLVFEWSDCRHRWGTFSGVSRSKEVPFNGSECLWKSLRMPSNAFECLWHRMVSNAFECAKTAVTFVHLPVHRLSTLARRPGSGQLAEVSYKPAAPISIEFPIRRLPFEPRGHFREGENKMKKERVKAMEKDKREQERIREIGKRKLKRNCESESQIQKDQFPSESFVWHPR